MLTEQLLPKIIEHLIRNLNFDFIPRRREWLQFYQVRVGDG